MSVTVPESPYDAIREIVPHLRGFESCRSTQELEAHPNYRTLRDRIEQVLCTTEAGDCTPGLPPPAKSAYRFLAWNIERGKELDGQLEAFRTHPYLTTCDVLLVTEADLGMARSGNRNVTREIAEQLGFHYVFAPCYWSLVKGSGIERHVEGENELGLHGNALLSRYPVRNGRAIRLRNGIDKMASREKRLGCQSAVAAEIDLPDGTVTAVSVHLDAQSSQPHRRDQMRDVLDQIPATGPVVIGGDWNTSTYNSSRAYTAIAGFWLRVFMGVDNVIRNHYLHPYNRFERDLFQLLEDRGYDYRGCNQLGEHTIWYDVDDRRTRQALGEWVPWWCFAFIRWALRNHGGHCPVKLDWFATRGVKTANPIVIHDLREGRETPLSDHDAIGVDINVS